MQWIKWLNIVNSQVVVYYEYGDDIKMRGIRWFFIIMVVTVIVTTSIGYYILDNNKESY